MMKEILSCYRVIKLLSIVIVVLANLSLYSGDALCASKLTRDKAATLIRKKLTEAVKIKPHEFIILLGLFKRLEDNPVSPILTMEREEKQSYGRVVAYYKYSFGPIGTKYFHGFYPSYPYQGSITSSVSLSEDSVSKLYGDGYSEVAILKKPVEVQVKVQGITSSGIEATAEYTWEYVNLPLVVKALITKGGNGTASFKLYDDGWRLTLTVPQYSDVPIDLTNKEKAELSNIMDGYIAKEKIKKEQLVESQTPTQQIGSFKLHRIVQTGYSPVDASPSADVEVSDVNITVTPTEHANVGQVGQSVVWFGDVAYPFIEKFYNSDKNTNIISVTLSSKQPVPGVTVAFNMPLYEEKLQLSSESESDISKIYEVLYSAFKRWREKYNVGNASIGEKLYTGDFPFDEGGQACIKCHSLDKRAPKSKGQGPNLISPNNPLIRTIRGHEENSGRRKSVFDSPAHKASLNMKPEDLIDIIAFMDEREKQSSK